MKGTFAFCVISDFFNVVRRFGKLRLLMTCFQCGYDVLMMFAARHGHQTVGDVMV